MRHVPLDNTLQDSQVTLRLPQAVTKLSTDIHRSPAWNETLSTSFKEIIVNLVHLWFVLCFVLPCSANSIFTQNVPLMPNLSHYLPKIRLEELVIKAGVGIVSLCFSQKYSAILDNSLSSMVIIVASYVSRCVPFSINRMYQCVLKHIRAWNNHKYFPFSERMSLTFCHEFIDYPIIRVAATSHKTRLL